MYFNVINLNITKFINILNNVINCLNCQKVLDMVNIHNLWFHTDENNILILAIEIWHPITFIAYFASGGNVKILAYTVFPKIIAYIFVTYLITKETFTERGSA